MPAHAQQPGSLGWAASLDGLLEAHGSLAALGEHLAAANDPEGADARARACAIGRALADATLLARCDASGRSRGE